MLNGGSIEKLKEMMGHSSVVVTERYAHLKPELFRAADYELLNVDLTNEGQVEVQLREPPKNAESGARSYVEATDVASIVGTQVATAGKIWRSPGSSVGRAED